MFKVLINMNPYQGLKHQKSLTQGGGRVGIEF